MRIDRDGDGKTNSRRKEVGASFDDPPAGRWRSERGAAKQRESGHHRLARVKETGKPGYGLAMDAVSLRRLPWDRMDRWWIDYQAEEQRRSAPSLRAAQKSDPVEDPS